MRKLTIFILIGFFLLAPTAIITATHNWDEISRTLGEIHDSLGKISHLIDKGALEEKKIAIDVLSLLERSNIPPDLIKLTQSQSKINSSQFDNKVNVNLYLTTSRGRGGVEGSVSMVGAFDNPRESLNSDIKVNLKATKNFTTLFPGLYIDEDLSDVNVDLTILQLDGKGYARLNDMPRPTLTGFYGLSKYINRWVDFGEASFKEAESIADMLVIMDLSDSVELRDSLRAYIEDPFLEFKKLSDARRDGGWYSSYKITINPTKLADFVVKAKQKEGADPEDLRTARELIKNLRGEIIVVYSEDNYEVKSISMDVGVVMNVSDMPAEYQAELLESDIHKVEIGTSMAFEQSKVNERIIFDLPRNTVPFEEVLDEIYTIGEQIRGGR